MKLFKHIKNRIRRSKIYQGTLSLLKRVVVPGFEGMSIYGVLNFLAKCFRKNQYTIKSASVAFNFFLAFIPAVLVLVSLIPYVPIDDFQVNLLTELEKMMPLEMYLLMEQTIVDLLLQKHAIALSIGFVISVFYSSRGINRLLLVFNSSYHLELKEKPLKRLLKSFATFLSFAVLFIIAFSILIYGEIVVYNLEDYKWSTPVMWVFTIVKWLVIVLFFMLSISTLYNLGNPSRVKWKWFSAGATLATVFIIIISELITLFFANFNSYNELYGSIGSVMILLIWMNAIAYLLIVGFDIHTLSDYKRKQLETKDFFIAPE